MYLVKPESINSSNAVTYVHSSIESYQSKDKKDLAARLQQRRETIAALLALGCPPLPVAPAQDPRAPYCHRVTRWDSSKVSYTKVGDDRALVAGDYCRLDENLQPHALFTGKNPSWLDRNGKPHLLGHKDYQNRLPTRQELAKWFANPLNGVGTLGGHSGVDWLDFDRKNYPSQEDCDRDVEQVRARVGATWVEKTGSGGWRIAVRPKQAPTFTNFSTDPSGVPHIGEALYQGRFTVLAPTIHPNGNPYQRVEFAPIAEVESLEALGIYPTKDEVSNQERRQKREKSGLVAVPSDPQSNPWDIRNFAEYLDGCRVEGAYYKCRCPAHQGTSDNSLHVHLDTGGYKCWSGCDTQKIYQAAKEAAIAGGYQPSPQQQMGRLLAKFNKLKGTLSKFLAKHTPILKPSQGFGTKPLNFVGRSDVVEVSSHAEGHRLAAQQGARLHVNVTGTGGQKSTFYSRVTPEFFGCERVIAVLPDALNPTVDGFKDWALLEGRHLGNVIDSDGKLRRATAETPESAKVNPANCDKAQAIQLLAERNPHSPSFLLACLNCHHSWKCGKESGDGYGARYSSSRAFKQDRIRTGYGRLNGQGDEAVILQKTALTLDESSANIETTRRVSISQRDISDKIVQIDRSHEPTLQRLKEFLHYLLTSEDYQKGDRFYGTNQAKLLPLFEPFLKDIDWEALARLEDETEELKAFGIKSDVERLTEAEQRRLKRLKQLDWLPIEDHREMERLESLPKRTKEQYQKLQSYRKTALTAALEQERDELQKRQLATRHENLSPSEMRNKAGSLTKRWLLDFLHVLTGATGHVHWGKDGITLTLPDDRHLSAIAAAQVVVLSDASEETSKAALSQKYGIPEDEIFIFRVKQPKGGTVEVVQVTGLGALGKNRGEGLEQCRQALVARFKELDPTHASFDWKKFDADGVLFRDNVGSNAYQHCKSISTALPRPNINAVLAEYCVLKKTCVDTDDEGFNQYYQSKIKNSLDQTRGRLREQLRPGQHLTFYVLADADLPIECDRTVAAADITPDAARKGERAIRDISEAVKILVQKGLKATQSAVARMTVEMGLNNGKGYTQQYVSKVWDKVLTVLQLFLGESYKKSCSLPAESQQHVADVVSMVEEIAKTNEPADLVDAIDWLNPLEWVIALHQLSDSARNLLFQHWLSLLPEEFVAAIAS